MKKIIFAFSLIISISGSAQTIIKRDPSIDQMVKEVSADSLKSYINTLVSFGTRSTLSTTSDSKKGIGAARDWAVSKFKQFGKNSGGRMNAFVDTVTLQADGKRIDKAINLGNAMGILKGTDPNDKRIYVISGHIDSRVTDVMNRTSDAPGANDDGSGTAAVIECARILSKSNFPATIIFVALSGEEQGLLGAKFMADKARSQNWQIEAVLNNDIMGSNNSNETLIINNTKVRIFSEGLPAWELDKKVASIRGMGLENDGYSRQLARYTKEVGERYVDNLEVMLIYRNDRFLRGGDHTMFIEKGFPAIRITEMNENFLHQHQDLRTENNVEYGDKPEFMDFEYLRKNTALNLATLSNLAKAPSMPQEVKIDVKGLGNSSSMNWKQPANGKTVGYYILIRETTSPVWQKKIYTADTKITIPYSKDNYFFAVQSVNEEGNESLAVLPSTR